MKVKSYPCRVLKSFSLPLANLSQYHENKRKWRALFSAVSYVDEEA
jgi:hypothetical protein